jgi:hypothetical protein
MLFLNLWTEKQGGDKGERDGEGLCRKKRSKDIPRFLKQTCAAGDRAAFACLGYRD